MDEGFVGVRVTPVGDRSADVRICSPDATGFGCDLARTMFDFGLVVERGDFSTDGKWSFLMFKVRAAAHCGRCGSRAAVAADVSAVAALCLTPLRRAPRALQVRPGNGLDSCPWALLKQRLEDVCPSDPSTSKLGRPCPTSVAPRQHFIFQARCKHRLHTGVHRR